MQEDLHPARLLSLDGGGTRGLSSLYILQHHEDSLHEGRKTCEYFDLMGGTSTGGIFAIMLVTLRMDIDTCIREYKKIFQKIFPVTNYKEKVNDLIETHPKSDLESHEKFDPKHLEDVIQNLVAKHFGDSDAPFNIEMREDPSYQQYKVFVSTTPGKGGKGSLLRGYDSTTPEASGDYAIWQCCLSAAGPFFPPMIMGEPPTEHYEGGPGYNNPIRHLMSKFSSLWPSRKVACIVSIGTGLALDPDDIVLDPDYFSKVVKQTERTARDFQQKMDDRDNTGKMYFRLNVEEGLGDINIPEWKQSKKIKNATQNYLIAESVKVEACASQLLFKGDSIYWKKPPPPADYQFFHVPTTTAEDYVDRLPQQEKLAEVLHNPLEQDKHEQRILIVHGQGGAGKSQLVLNHIQNYKSDYAGISWIDAHRTEPIENYFVQLHSEIFDIKDPRTDDSEIQNIRYRVLDWFKQKAKRYLLVFNGADVLNRAEVSSSMDLDRFIPLADSVDIIITTRQSTVGFQDRPCISLEVGGRGCSEALTKECQHGAKSIVSELGCLPLAVQLAGSFISNRFQTQQGLGDYLRLYQNHRENLLTEKPSQLLNRYNQSVLTSWETSCSAMSEEFGLAIRLIYMMAFLDPENIYLSLFDLLRQDDLESFESDQTPDATLDEAESALIKSSEIKKALSVLELFSFIQWIPDRSCYSIHSLVHAWAYDRLDAKQRRSLISFVVKYLGKKTNDSYRLEREV